jgi:hypothetical protein
MHREKFESDYQKRRQTPEIRGSPPDLLGSNRPRTQEVSTPHGSKQLHEGGWRPGNGNGNAPRQGLVLAGKMCLSILCLCSVRKPIGWGCVPKNHWVKGREEVGFLSERLRNV